MTRHTQVTASGGIQVDEGMRELLEALWALGMVTEFSCQNYGARTLQHDGASQQRECGYICFARFTDAVRFVLGSRWLCTHNTDTFTLEIGGLRGFVDFPAHLLPELTMWWQKRVTE